MVKREYQLVMSSICAAPVLSLLSSLSIPLRCIDKVVGQVIEAKGPSAMVPLHMNDCHAYRWVKAEQYSVHTLEWDHMPAGPDAVAHVNGQWCNTRHSNFNNTNPCQYQRPEWTKVQETSLYPHSRHWSMFVLVHDAVREL